MEFIRSADDFNGRYWDRLVAEGAINQNDPGTASRAEVLAFYHVLRNQEYDPGINESVLPAVTTPVSEPAPSRESNIPDLPAIMLGMPDAVDSAPKRRAAWEIEKSIPISDKAALRIGMRDGLAYILDPRTSLPVTRGFEQVHHMDNDSMTYEVQGKWFKVTPADHAAAARTYRKRLMRDDPDEILQYPLFLHAPELLYTPVFPVQEEAQPAEETTADTSEDLFGLEQKDPSDEVAEIGQTVFDNAVSAVLAFAKNHASTAAQLRDAEAPVALPPVVTAQFKGRLIVSTFNEGNSVMYFSGDTDPRRHTGTGFYLVQDIDRNVMIIDNSLQRVLTHEDDDYLRYARAAEEYLTRYFTLLNTLGKTATTTLALHDIRAQLGTMNDRQMRRILGNLGGSTK